MRIDAGQHMRMDQRMKLAPRMIQSMEILQLGAQALEARIEQELTSNPTLELNEAGLELEDLEAEREQVERDATEGERELVLTDQKTDSGSGEDFERLSNISEEYGESWSDNTYETSESYHPARDTGERDAKLDAMANTASRPQSLADQLLSQWVMVESTPHLRAAGDYLIGFIDDDGYIRTEWKQVVDQTPTGVDRDLLLTALTSLQRTLEPVGLAARDLQECLLLQINAREKALLQEGEQADFKLERRLVTEHLKDIEMNRLPKIAKDEGVDVEEIKRAIANLRQFDPRPGRSLVSESPQTITPDAIVEYDESLDRYVARLAGDRMPQLHINTNYIKMSRDPNTDRKTRNFVGNNLRNARWLIDAIQQRQHTLMRVIHVVLEAQREFFDLGPQHLRPLPMTLVADQLGLHVATVSRAVAEKYIQTPRGIFPLRMFFSGGTETQAGDAMSWTAVQAKLEEVIKNEDKSNPLNDDELVEKLKEQGIEIARRTVAKYRKQLDIPPARQRREY
ncbi:MAG: RNA polymerase factor sigma-54 [Phycisphaera sp.]|nr:RNA polymerase factor sigma-54 [Phycisphaera sp.]